MNCLTGIIKPYLDSLWSNEIWKYRLLTILGGTSGIKYKIKQSITLWLFTLFYLLISIGSTQETHPDMTEKLLIGMLRTKPNKPPCFFSFFSLFFLSHIFFIFTAEGTETPPGGGEGQSFTTPLIAVIAGALAIVIVVVVVFGITRKRARGVTWFPEGFFSLGGDSEARRSKRHGPDGGEEMK